MKCDFAMVSNGIYNLYFKFAEKNYENCTLYTIVNGDNDYSDLVDMSDIDQLKSSALNADVLSAESEYIYIDQSSIIDISLQYSGVAKIAFQIDYEDIIAESDREISSLEIFGQIYTNTYLFNESSTTDLATTSNIYADTESLSCIVGRSSVISSFSITLKNGKQYTASFPGELTLKSGVQHFYNIYISYDSLSINSSNITNWEDTNIDSLLSTITNSTR